MAIGAYVSAIVSVETGAPFFVAFVAGVVASGVVAVALATVLRRLNGIYLAIASIAFAETVRVAVLNIPITGGAQGLVGIPAVRQRCGDLCSRHRRFLRIVAAEALAIRARDPRDATGPADGEPPGHRRRPLPHNAVRAVGGSRRCLGRAVRPHVGVRRAGPVQLRAAHSTAGDRRHRRIHVRGRIVGRRGRRLRPTHRTDRPGRVRGDGQRCADRVDRGVRSRRDTRPAGICASPASGHRPRGNR